MVVCCICGIEWVPESVSFHKYEYNFCLLIAEILFHKFFFISFNNIA
jgi:hypothetical protein